MYRQATIAAVLCLLNTGIAAAPGELSGAYGGDSEHPVDAVHFRRVDKNGNGSIDRAEARAAGIEQFDSADTNQDGSLDKSEFSAMEFTDTKQGDKPMAGEKE